MALFESKQKARRASASGRSARGGAEQAIAIDGLHGARRGRARVLVTLAAVVASTVAIVVAMPACSSLDPDVGDLTVCNDADSDPNTTVSFKAQIRPLMKGQGGGRPCGDCHSPTKGTHEGFDEVGLNLDSLGTLRLGGRNTGTGIIVPGSPCKSPIVQKLRGTFGGARMPKDGPYWTPEQIQVMKDWIVEGARGEDSE